MTPRHLLTRAAIAISVVAAVVGGLAAAYRLGGSGEAAQASGNSPDSERMSDAARVLKVTTCELRSAGPAFLTQRYTGIVSARRSSQLAAKSVGRVESVEVKLGDGVTEGQLLVRLDDQQLKAQHAAAEANLTAARAQLLEFQRGPRRQDIEQAESQVAELEANLDLGTANLLRNEELRKSSSISIQEFDESRFMLKATQAQLDSARQALERLQEGTRREQIESQLAIVAGLTAELERSAADLDDRQIVAPFSGFVQRRFVDEGAVVAAGEPLLEMVEAAPYEVHVGLPPEIADSLVETNLAVFRGDQRLSASIVRKAPAIQESTRTREVVLLLSEASSKALSIGSAVSVETRLPVATQGYWIPSRALTAGPRGLWAIYVAVPADAESEEAGHIVERRQVELLRADGEWSEVRGPLAASESLVVEGVHRITAGQRVECVPVASFASQE